MCLARNSSKAAQWADTSFALHSASALWRGPVPRRCLCSFPLLLFLSGLPVWLLSKDKGLWGWWLTAQHFLWLTLCHLGHRSALTKLHFFYCWWRHSLQLTSLISLSLLSGQSRIFSCNFFFFFGRSCLPPHGFDSLSVSTIPCRAWWPSPPRGLAVGAAFPRGEVQPGPLPSRAAASPFISCLAHSSTVTLAWWQCSWWHHTGAGA